MDRLTATNRTRSLLDKYNLSEWGVRISTNVNIPFVGLCSFKDKVIILNAHHIDIHPDSKVEDTILHEIAHAIVGSVHQHDLVWLAKAKELGCTGNINCSMSMPPAMIDAIRSGNLVEVETIETIVKTPKYTVTRLQDMCPDCLSIGKRTVAEEVFSVDTVDTSGNIVKLITLKCFHIIKRITPKDTPFETMVSNDWKDEIKSCKHSFPDRETAKKDNIPPNQCTKCGEYKLYDFQITGARAAELGLSQQKGYGIFDDMGLGKGQILSDNILTPNGWLTFKDLVVGTSVIGSDGQSYTVTNIYERGQLPVYRVTFTDESYVTVDIEHLWQVNSPLRNSRSNPTITKQTIELISDLVDKAGNFKWQVQVTKPVNFTYKDLPIAPYELGLLLGDGSFRNNQVNITSIDEEIINVFKWRRQDKITYFLENDYLQRIRVLGLDGRSSIDKFIPDIYRLGSQEQRLALLQGLMDTDGSIWNNGVIEYTTISPYLAKGVKYLIESLGGTVKISTKQGSYTKNDVKVECNLSYRLILNIPINPFRLSRKANQYTYRVKYKPIRVIKSIEFVGIEEVRCITVDSPDNLYITNDFIVTHNTVQGLAIPKFHAEYTPFLVVTKSAITYQWFKQIIRWLGPDYMPQIIRTGKDYLMPGLKSYVVAYDLLRRFDREKLFKLGIKLVLLDECQQIKNPDSSRTQEVRKLVSNNPETKVLPLSGTPWKNRGSEFFPVLNMIDPYKFSSHQGYLDRWVDYYYQGAKRKMGGIKNVKRFKEYTSGLLIRREYNEVMDEFPEINRMKLPVQLDELQQDVYDGSESEFVAWYNEHVIGGTEDSISGIELIGRMARMRHITGLAKIPATLGYIEEYLNDTDRKLVVFVQHKDVGQLMYDSLKGLNSEYKELADALTEQSIPVYSYHSGLNDVERFEMQQSFNNSNRAFMIASTLACGEGVDLQSCADCIMHERQWNPQDEDQAAPGRFRRIGQLAKVINITVPEAEGSIDEDMDIIVSTKRRAYHEAMNKGEVPQWNESEIVKELASRIVAKHKKKQSKSNTIPETRVIKMASMPLLSEMSKE